MKRLLTGIVCLMFVGLSYRQEVPVSNRLSKGQLALYNACYDSAIYYFKSSIPDAQHETEAKLFLLQTYLVKNDFSAANAMLGTIPLVRSGDSAKYHRLWGVLALEQSDLATATSHFAKAYKINTPLDVEKCALMNDWGNLYLETNQFDKAQELYNAAFKSLKKIPKNINSQYVLVRTLINLGNIQYYKSHLDTASYYYKEAAKNAKTYFGKNHYLYGLAYSNIGLVQEVRGYYDDALKSYEISKKIYQHIFGEQHKNMAELYCSIGSTFYSLNEFELSKNYFEKELYLRKKIQGPKHNSIAFVYKNLGAANLKLGDFVSSEKQLKFSIQLNQQNFGKWHSETAESTLELAKFFLKTEKFDSAIVYAMQCKEISQHIDGKYSETIGVSDIVIAEALFHQQMFKASTESSLEAFQTLERVFQTKNHPLVIEAEILISENMLKSNLPEESAAWCETALVHNNVDINHLERSIQSQTYLFEIDLLKTLSIYSKVLFHLSISNNDKEQFYLDKAHITCHAALLLSKRIMNTMYSGEGKFNVLEIQAAICETGVLTSYKLFQKNKDQNYLSSVLHFIESNKANLVKMESEKLEYFHLAKVDPKLIKKEKNLQSDINYLKNEKLYFWSDSRDVVAMQKIQEKIFYLENEYQMLIQYIQKKYPEYYSIKFHQNEWKVKDVQSMISKDAVVLEYGVYKDFIFCLLISKTNILPILINENLEHEINALTETEIYTADTLFFDHSRSIFNKIFPISCRNFLKDKTLVVFPESYLNKLPFELLIQKGNHQLPKKNWDYLIQTNPIIYNTSIYFYAREIKKNTGKGIALISIPEKENELPFAIKEVNDISRLFGKNQCLSTSKEHLFKKKSPTYACLHFATHAVLNDSTPNYSYLVMDSGKAEDGKLFTHEIYGLDLHATLVSLSACETGAGKTITGEGNISLARAFTYAGCPNIILSTWKIPDATSYKIMTTFYKNLKMGMGKEKALQLAKIAIIQHPDRFEDAPVYWAGLRLQGNRENIVIHERFDFKWWGMVGVCIGLLVIYRFQMKRRNSQNPYKH